MAKREQAVAEQVVEETLHSIAQAQAEYEQLMEEIRVQLVRVDHFIS